jgi:hypothetical protein
VANRNKARRGARSRKRRPDASRIASPSAGASGTKPPRAKPSQAHSSAPSYGERPQAPWHPLPLSELLILIGAIGTVVGLRRGISHGGPPLFAGIAAVALGTIEVTLREHLGGYRSHTLILALLPVIVLHSVAVLAVAAFTRPPQVLNVGLLVVDFALFVALFKLLRARFLDARTRAISRR